tara:strand:+ start:122 stop:784 length:663 start_codon:yes stop_codon:yes gene_type:complete
VRDIIRKILKEQTENVIPNNKKVYVDKVLKRWETDPMRTKQFIDVYGIDTDMALYIRQKIQEDLKNVPIGKKIWLLDKDFPLDVGIGNYDFKFTIDNIADAFNGDGKGYVSSLIDEVGSKNLNFNILTDMIVIDATIYPEGSVHINVQEDDGEYELKEFSIYDALNDDSFGWEVEGEVQDIIREYIISFSPLLYKVRPLIELQLFSESKWQVELMRKGYD